MHAVRGRQRLVDLRLDRVAGLAPGAPAAVEHGHAIVADPAQHPPQSRSDRAADIVVGHDLIVGADAAPAEPRGELVGVGQRVATVAPVARAGQIFVQMQEARAGDVALCIGVAPGARVGKIMTAVDDSQAFLSKMGGQRTDVDDCVVMLHSMDSVGVSIQANASASSLKTSTWPSTKSCVTHALQVTHSLSVSTAMRRKSLLCWRENLMSS